MTSIHDSVLDLVVSKGLSEAQAITKVEATLRAKIPDHIKASIRGSLNWYYATQSKREGNK